MFQLNNGVIPVKQVKVHQMNSHKVWEKPSKKQWKRDEVSKTESKKQAIKKVHKPSYTKEQVLNDCKRYGGHFIYFPAYKNSETYSGEGYLLAAGEQDGKLVYLYYDKDRNLNIAPVTKVFAFREIPAEFLVLDWLTTHANKEFYDETKALLKDQKLITDVYLKLIEEKKKR